MSHPVPNFARSRAALARAITQIENERPGAEALWREARAHCGNAQIVGITGAPGAGKSTLISALLSEYRARDKRVAVLAVDPSSPVTGGALLGDRVRMGECEDEGVFIRSVSARGHLGGLSRTAGRIIDVFDAAGFDVVIVETVGAGQSEVEIASHADVRVVLCAPGLGDEVQAIKAGVLEIADVLVVSKADSPLAARTLNDLKANFARRHQGAWPVMVMPTAATNGEGIPALVDALEAHAAQVGVGRRLRAKVTLANDTGNLTLAIVGATALARVLAPMAVLAGFRVLVVEPRRSSHYDATGEVSIMHAMPQKALAEVQGELAIALLTRDPAIVADALHAARDKSAFYCGMVSRKARDFAPHAVPLGMNLYARNCGERAVAILAGILAARPPRA